MITSKMIVFTFFEKNVFVFIRDDHEMDDEVYYKMMKKYSSNVNTANKYVK